MSTDPNRKPGMIPDAKHVRMLQVLKDIQDDMSNDATKFDGQPFNGRTVAEYFGHQGAAINALARIVAELVAADDESGMAEVCVNAGCQEIR